MKNITMALLAGLLLSGCARHMIQQAQLDQVNSVAVVMYAVPQTIIADERKPTDINGDKDIGIAVDPLAIAGQLLGGTTQKVLNVFDNMADIQQEIDGNEAANLTLAAMIAELHQQQPWQFLTPEQVAANPEYQSLSAGLLQSQSIQLQQQIRRDAGVPDGYLNLGLPYSHGELINYYDYPEFRLWVEKTAQALQVDAVMLVHDTGFATDQQSLFRGGDCFTKSAFHVAMFNRRGELIVDTRGSFEEAPEIPQQGCVNGMFHKADYKAALFEHGTTQARVITERLKSS
ncbi:hypothetical protein VV869_01135 [Photobacterium sp. MCCC 1A19761]|uniref:hypothetical protein n=1 Tax=Photobacterium sp. MCCC 1A19761 TaxID=3115000 RepID=UPI00307D44F7